MISGFTDVDKNEDADSSKLQEVQQLSTRSPHLIETEYAENRHFLRHHGNLAHHNQNSKPFSWTANADSILKKIARFCVRTSDSVH